MRRARSRRLLILTYHRVLPAADPMRPLELTADTFASQMRWLRRLFNVLPLAEARVRQETGRLPARSVAITFDDGYADNAEIAAPILVRQKVPATFFVVTGVLAGIMWNDRIIEAIRRCSPALDLSDLGVERGSLSSLAARIELAEAVIAAWKYLDPADRSARVDELERRAGADQPPALMMSVEQVRKLHRDGMTIGAHTVSHPILVCLGASEARAEMMGSRAALESMLGAQVELFAYPNGRIEKDYREEHAQMAREAGFKLAVSTNPGAATADSDAFHLPRVAPWAEPGWKLAARLSRYF